MPRTFTRHELNNLPLAEFDALSVEDKNAYNRQLLTMWETNYTSETNRYLTGDYDRVASGRRYEAGE